MAAAMLLTTSETSAPAGKLPGETGDPSVESRLPDASSSVYEVPAMMSKLGVILVMPPM